MKTLLDFNGTVAGHSCPSYSVTPFNNSNSVENLFREISLELLSLRKKGCPRDIAVDVVEPFKRLCSPICTLYVIQRCLEEFFPECTLYATCDRCYLFVLDSRGCPQHYFINVEEDIWKLIPACEGRLAFVEYEGDLFKSPLNSAELLKAGSFRVPLLYSTDCGAVQYTSPHFKDYVEHIFEEYPSVCPNLFAAALLLDEACELYYEDKALWTALSKKYAAKRQDYYDPSYGHVRLSNLTKDKETEFYKLTNRKSWYCLGTYVKIVAKYFVYIPEVYRDRLFNINKDLNPRIDLGIVY